MGRLVAGCRATGCAAPGFATCFGDGYEACGARVDRRLIRMFDKKARRFAGLFLGTKKEI
jgi:hypothetical protein